MKECSRLEAFCLQICNISLNVFSSLNRLLRRLICFDAIKGIIKPIRGRILGSCISNRLPRVNFNKILCTAVSPVDLHYFLCTRHRVYSSVSQPFLVRGTLTWCQRYLAAPLADFSGIKSKEL